MMRYDLLRLPVIRSLLVNRWPQFILRALALAGFVFAILSGWLGTPVGSRNLSIVVVWIAWWAMLMLVAVPLLGRGWCSICPIPMPGEWLQNGGILVHHSPTRPLRKWPKKLRNIWLQNAGFALLALFSTVILTQPQATALVLATFLLLATGMGVIFERRAFCRYLCPVGGFIGLYSQAAPLELRVRDTAVCAGHREKTCYTGSDQGVGCPWGTFPAGMVRNNVCGLCMECLRTCPSDNLALNLRPFGADLTQPRGRGLDEAFKGFIMLGGAIVYSAVMLGPWGALKNTAYAVGSGGWWLYAAAFLGLTFIVLPGLFYLCLLTGGGLTTPSQIRKQKFVAYSYALVPIGLAAWVAFSLSFVFANISYLWPVLSDPFGWGWNLFGTAGWGWTPYLTGFTPFLQAGVLVAGLVGAVVTAYRIAGEDHPKTRRGARPVILYSFLLMAGILWLLVG